MRRVRVGRAPAGCKPAIRQIENLRYAKRLLRILALAVSFFVLNSPDSSQAAESKPPSPLEVKCVHPHQGDIMRSITLPGAIKAYQQSTLYAKVAGYLKRINVDKGDAVKEGDLLAEIEAPELIADLAKFKAEMEVAKIDFERTVEAQKKAPDLVVPQSVDNARGKFEIAKANLERIEILLGFAKITAPFAGIVTMRYVDPGAFIPAATSGSAANTAALVTLMDLSKVRVQVAVPELEASRVVKGLPVQVTVEGLGHRVFDGTVTRHTFALEDATRTMLVEADLQNTEWELRPGMFATIRLGIEKRANVLLLPVAAVLFEKAGNSVFTVVNSQARKVPVKTGFEDGRNVEILPGATAENRITAEDQVIVVGKQVLNTGQPVKVTETP